MCRAAAGIRVPQLPRGSYVLRVQHWHVDPHTGTKTTDPTGFSQLDVPFTVAADAAALSFTAAPVRRTRYRTAKFTVTGVLSSGGNCGSQCVDFMCKASFEDAWRLCGVSGQPGVASVEYLSVPSGASTFEVTATDTGSWPLDRDDKAKWRALQASCVHPLSRCHSRGAGAGR